MKSAITTTKVDRIRTLASELDQLGQTALEKAVEAGSLLRECKAGLDHGQWLPWLKSNFSFSDRTARRWIQVAEDSSSGKLDTMSNLNLSEAYRSVTETKETIPAVSKASEPSPEAETDHITVEAPAPAPHVANNSGENEWYSPAHIIEAARAVMGAIDVDPASSEIANRTVKADEFFTKDQDGLTKEWTGNVWLNPPYAQPLVDRFIAKLINEVDAGNITSAIVLVNNATETKWFQCLANVATAICFPSRRIRFDSPQDKQSRSPLQGQSIIYLGDDIKAFVSAFHTMGFITRTESETLETLNIKSS